MGCSTCGQRYRKSATLSRSHGVVAAKRLADSNSAPRHFGFVREVSMPKEPEQLDTVTTQIEPLDEVKSASGGEADE